MKPIIFPYKMGSVSAKALSKSLETIRVYPDRLYRPKENHLIVNWGNSLWPSWAYYDGWSGETTPFLNYPKYVKQASNKLLSFQLFKDNFVSTPEWTTDYNLVIQWVQEEHLVYGRRVLSGHSGFGIEVCNPTATWERGQYSSSLDDIDSFRGCPLYTKKVKSKKEFRVHVFSGQVIDITQKRKRIGAESNGLIKNLSNGWVFTREDMIVPDCVKEEAIKAVQALGLDFGAVDVAWNEYQNKSYVFEVNTACGLEGTTLTKYKEAIENYVIRL